MRSRLTGVLLAALCALPVALSASLPAPTRQWDGWGGLSPPQKAPALGGLDRARDTVATAPAWQQIQDLCESDGWDACYMACLQDPGCRGERVDGADVFVTEIADPMGNRPALVQASASAQPKLVVGAFGGLDGTLGDGVGTQMATEAFAVQAQPYSVVYLIEPLTLGGFRAVSGGDTAQTNDIGFLTGSDGEDRWRYYAGSNRAGGAVSLEPNIVTAHFDGDASVLRVNGVPATSSNPGTRGYESLHLFTLLGSERLHGRLSAPLTLLGTWVTVSEKVEAMECLLASLSEITVAGCD